MSVMHVAELIDLIPQCHKMTKMTGYHGDFKREDVIRDNMESELAVCLARMIVMTLPDKQLNLTPVHKKPGYYNVIVVPVKQRVYRKPHWVKVVCEN